MDRHCNGFGALPAHDATEQDFSKGKTRCRTCTAAYFADWKARKNAAAQPSRPGHPDFSQANPAPDLKPERKVVDLPAETPMQDLGHRDLGHTYRPDPALVSLWDAIVAANDAGDHLVLAMHGPQGSGKTDGAQYLAERAGRPLVKVDAKSVVDAEAWFGTRGAVEGTTFYHPSEFVKALQRRSVIFIDEYTRTSNEVRDVLNPFMDGTRSVLNPITGERISMHPECIVILGGNVGFKFTGVFDVDIATTSRLCVFNIGYLEPDVEAEVIVEHAKIDKVVAGRLVSLAGETRKNPQMTSVSTRELLQTAVLIARGLDEDAAVTAKIIAPASDQGDEASPRAKLATLWGGYKNQGAAEDATQAEFAAVHATARSHAPLHGLLALRNVGVLR